MATPSLYFAPEGYKAGTLFTQLPTDGTGDFTFARASKKNRINKDLNLEIIANDVPDLSYDTLGGCPFLRTEPQATNLITYPISFNNAYWTKIGTTIEGDPSTAINKYISDFSLGADTFIPRTADTTVNGNVDGVFGRNDVLSIASANALASTRWAERATTTTIGKIYKVTFDYYLPSSNINVVNVMVGLQDVLYGVKDAWTTITRYFYAIDTKFYLYLADTTDSYINPATTGDIAYFSNIVLDEVQGYPAPSIDFPTKAYKLVESIGGTLHYIRRNITVTSGANVAITIYAKAAERAKILLQEVATGNSAYFNLDTGTIDVGYNASTATMQLLANGYYKCSITTTVPSTVSGMFVYILNGTVSYSGDGTSGIYLFMAQIKEGSGETSPTFTDTTLATEGATSTRLADVCGGAGTIANINSLEGVLFFKIADNLGTSSSRGIYIDDGSLSNKMYAYFYSNSNRIYFDVTIGGVTIVSSLSIVISDRFSLSKIAVRWKLNDYSIWYGGTKVEQLSGIVPVSNTYSKLNYTAGVDIGNSAIYSTYLTDSKMITLIT